MSVATIFHAWLHHHMSNTLPDYAITMALALLAWGSHLEVVRGCIVFPRITRGNGIGIKLEFVGSLILATFISLVVDYYPPLAAGVTFLALVGGSYLFRSFPRRQPLCHEAASEELIAIHEQNLARLRIIEARCGMNVPLNIQNEIEYTLKEIERLSGEMS